MLFPFALLLSLLALPIGLAAATTTTTPTTATTTSLPPSLHTATLHALPVTPTPSKPHPLAVLTYSPLHPHLSTLKAFTPPANTSDPDALTSVAVYLDGRTSGDGYRSSVTATYGFHAPYKGRFRVVLDAKGEVVAASWHSSLPRGSPAAGKGGRRKGGSGEGRRGDFDILSTRPAPSVVFDKAAKGKGAGAAGAGTGAGVAAGTAGGEGEEEVVEKTLLQKYWWVLLGVAILAMAGGGDK